MRPADVMAETINPPDSAYTFSEIKLHAGARINRWEDKAGFYHLFNYAPVASPAASSGSVIEPASVIDLTSKLSAIGSLEWKVPAGNWRNYKDDPSKSPVDAHMLISLIAPRPLLLQTGDTDKWSDPKGEFLAAVAAAPVYKLLGKKSLETDVYPAPGVPILNDLGYYMHAGGHGAMPSDYEIFIRFMKMHF